MNINKLVRSNIGCLIPYQSARRIGGKGDVWLNANESPDALSSTYTITRQAFNRYPECQPEEVLVGYASYAGVNKEQVLITRGADEGIELLIRAFCEPQKDKVLYCPPTYGMYGISAQTFDVEAVTIATTQDWQLDLQAISEAITDVKLIYVCNPNNPTGNLLKAETIRALLEMARDKAIVVVDEAYIEFSCQSSVVGWLADYPNLVILRTLSKAFALAGLRCGFVLASQCIIAELLKVIAPYPIATPVANIASQALEKEGLRALQQRVERIVASRNWLQQTLQACAGVEQVFSSESNFLLVRFSEVADIFSKLSGQGIVVRDQGQQLGLKGCLRITVGSQEECQRVVDVLNRD